MTIHGGAAVATGLLYKLRRPTTSYKQGQKKGTLRMVGGWARECLLGPSCALKFQTCESCGHAAPGAHCPVNYLLWFHGQASAVTLVNCSNRSTRGCLRGEATCKYSKLKSFCAHMSAWRLMDGCWTKEFDGSYMLIRIIASLVSIFDTLAWNFSLARWKIRDILF